MARQCDWVPRQGSRLGGGRYVWGGGRRRRKGSGRASCSFQLLPFSYASHSRIPHHSFIPLLHPTPSRLPRFHLGPAGVVCCTVFSFVGMLLLVSSAAQAWLLPPPPPPPPSGPPFSVHSRHPSPVPSFPQSKISRVLYTAPELTNLHVAPRPPSRPSRCSARTSWWTKRAST